MIAQNTKQINAHHLYFLAGVAGLGILVSGLYLLGNSYTNRLFANTYINSIDVSGKTLEEAIQTLEANKYELPEHQVVAYVDDIAIASDSSQLDFHIDFQEAVEQTYITQHAEHPIANAAQAVLAHLNETVVTAPTKYSEEKLGELFVALNQKVELIGENPTISLQYSNAPLSLIVTNGQPGREIHLENSIERANEKVLEEQQNKSELSSVLIPAEVASTSTVLTKEEQEKVRERGVAFVGASLQAKADDYSFEITDKELITLLNPLGGYDEKAISEVISKWEEKVVREPINAIFEYERETLKVTEFVPHRDGLQLDSNATENQVKEWLKTFEQLTASEAETTEHENRVIEISLERTAPEVTLEETNELGINERIGFGESYYHHSILNRVHNVGITAERISYTIIPPGTEFSFNKTLGEVSSRTGFRSAYVIQGGKTVLGDGGGVCQVSSTLFRSVLDAGLDVSKRLQHSYRVSYYELNSDPGFDATVYSGDIDFRFINDTPGHVLLLANVDSENRYMNIEIYGTDDGRTSEIYDYKKWGFVGPPAPEYYPTNTLPTGVTEQVDWAVSGIKTEFKHTVKDAEGNVIHDDVYYSNYRPWSAKFMVGI